jgi:hypothetical protein
MAQSANIISKIKLPSSSTVYEIYDAKAIHELADLGLDRVMQFKGVVASTSNLPSTGSIGDVYHITDIDSEVVWTDNGEWEDFGSKFITNHKHSFSASGSITNGSAAAQTWTQKTGSAAAQTWTQKSGTITGSGTVSVPKVTKAANYAKVSTTAASSTNDTFVKSYPGATSKMVVTSIAPAVDNASVVSGVTAPTGSVTGVSGSVTASKASAGTAKEIAKAGTAVNVPNVTAAGSASTWSFTVSGGVLTIGGSNSTAPTLGTPISITPAVDNGEITPYTFTDVTVPKAATSATTVVTSVSTSKTTVATAGEAVDVATGALASTGTGASVMTGLGTASTAKALTGVTAIKTATLAEGTSTDGVLVGDTVTISSEDKTVSITGSATVTGTNAASNVTVTGTNAASTVTGTVSHSGTSGLPTEA